MKTISELIVMDWVCSTIWLEKDPLVEAIEAVHFQKQIQEELLVDYYCEIPTPEKPSETS